MGNAFNHWIKQLVKDLPLTLAIMISSLALLVLVAMYTEPPDFIRIEIENEIKDILMAIANSTYIEKVYNIYTRNAFANILFVLPFFINIAMYISTMVTTAWALHISAIMLESSIGVPAYLSVMSLIVMPHTYLELLSYSLSITASLRFTVSLIKRRIDRTALYCFLFTVLLSNAMLLLSAVIEAILANI